MALLRKYLIAGLIVWVPLGATLLVIKVVVDLLDQVLLILPERYHPDALLGFHLPGLGVLLSVAIVLATGVTVANLFGRQLVAAWEALLARIPLVRTIYSSVKQLTESVFSAKGSSFRKVFLVEFPRQGMWTLGFYTSDQTGEVTARLGQDLVNIYVPTVPIPSTGYFVMLPRSEVIELDMSVDDALKMMLTLGVIIPEWKKRELTGEV
ncbi:MAG: DUF502 domain-containing protein [Gammaproteobacteria bacterium]|nr:DUF502 domain-containing protein [Gammaproteobacteria bacterium]